MIKAAFSLIELLVVIAIISLMSSAALLLTPSLRASTGLQKNLSGVAGLLELARQAAVTRNTYVYVGLLYDDGSESSVPAGERKTYAAAFLSLDGTDALGTATQANDTPSSGTLRLLDPVQQYNGLEFQASLPANNALAQTLDPQNASAPSSTWNVTTSARPAGALTFNRVIKFTPKGEARVNSAPVEAIEIILAPSHGGALNDMERSQASVIRISGLTGKVTVHQVH